MIMPSLELVNLKRELEKQNYILIELTEAINELTEAIKQKEENDEVK